MRQRIRPKKDEIYQSDIENKQRAKEDKRWLKSKPKIFVLGGGFTGILTASILNAKAIKTGVVEKQKQLANSWITFDKNISRDGFFHFDNFEGLSLHSHSLLSRVLKEIGVYNKFNIINLKHSAFIKNKLQEFTLNNNSKQLLTSLKKKYPLIELRLNDLFQILKKGFDDNFYFFETLKKFKNAKLFLEHYTRYDRNLMLNFDWMWMEFGIPLSKLDPFTFAIFLADYIIGGLHYLSSGSKELVGVLARYIQSNSKNKDLIIKSSPITSLKVNDDYITKISTLNKTLKVRKYVLSAPLYDTFQYLISDNSESYKTYTNTINKFKFKNYKVSVCAGITKNFRTIMLTHEIVILNEHSLDDDQAYHATLNNDYEHVPLKIINHGLLYPGHSNKTCSLNISFVDNFSKYEFDDPKKLDERREKIQNIIINRLNQFWPKTAGHFYFMKVYLHQDQAALTDNTLNGGYGMKVEGYNPWIDHYFSTPYKNLLVASKSGLPGINPWFSIYSALRASNAVEVKIKKRQMYALIDSLSGTDILKLLSYAYAPLNDRWTTIQIGWFFDNVYSVQMGIGESKITLRSITYEEASRLPFFVYTTTNALKKIVKGQSGFLKQIFTNNMRCKGGAFKFMRLMRECFPNYAKLDDFFKKFLQPNDPDPKENKPPANQKVDSKKSEDQKKVVDPKTKKETAKKTASKDNNDKKASKVVPKPKNIKKINPSSSSNKIELT
ncbi:hypothetical protein [Mycoplasma sp. SG1]|uniref:hypothetical protein n=1 Tax=Mycoplasma sp. SG1 TaxID=2810348 RepID=UPI0020251AED|nr:hypothetical protein [Mycoplasma sp. SG1]URM53153.1 hypothetical protein JRW51_02280 [Mycoplasma sp. SG1]